MSLRREGSLVDSLISSLLGLHFFVSSFFCNKYSLPKDKLEKSKDSTTSRLEEGDVVELIPPSPPTISVREKESSSFQDSATDRAQSKAKKSRSLSQSANPRTQSNGNGASAQSPKEGRNCKLMNWARTNHEVVALGEIISTDPTALAHFVPIGKNCWKVAVHNVLDDDAPMYRPTQEFFLIREALGSTVAWPIDDIEVL